MYMLMERRCGMPEISQFYSIRTRNCRERIIQLWLVVNEKLMMWVLAVAVAVSGLTFKNGPLAFSHEGLFFLTVGMCVEGCVLEVKNKKLFE